MRNESCSYAYPLTQTDTYPRVVEEYRRGVYDGVYKPGIWWDYWWLKLGKDGESIYGLLRKERRRRKDGVMVQSKYVNKNILKSAIYHYFAVESKTKDRIRREVSAYYDEVVKKNNSVDSLVSQFFKAELIRRTQILTACCRTLIKVSLSGSGKTKNEKIALDFYNRTLIQVNKNLSTPYEKHELPKVK